MSIERARSGSALANVEEQRAASLAALNDGPEGDEVGGGDAVKTGLRHGCSARKASSFGRPMVGTTSARSR
jgi:hypothetical protein